MKKIGFLILLCILNSQVRVYTQESESPIRVIPMSPEASAITQYGNIDMNLAKGIPNISVPIFTLSVSDLDIPISISYDASGIRVNDIASSVGLKWTLNTGGMISRNIVGLADNETSDGYFNSSEDLNTTCDIDVLEYVYNSDYDISPDEYYYNFLGYSGAFLFNKDEELLFGHHTNLKVIAPWDLSPQRFEIIDDKGNLYIFSATETNQLTVKQSTSTITNRTGSGTTGWLLTEIITPRQDTVKYYYSSNTLNYTYTASYSITKSTPSQSGDGLKDYDNTFLTSRLLVDSIVTPYNRAEFSYATDATLSVSKSKLTQIDIVEKISGDEDGILTVKLKHSSYSGDARLKLTNVEFWDTSSKIYEYSFDYNTNNLPTFGSHTRDVFGYNNSNSETHMIPDVDGYGSYSDADRTIDETKIKYGILTKITYPTGGYSEFTYEANKEVLTGDDKFAPGVRVSSIVNKDAGGSILTEKQFEYSGLSGAEVWTEYDYSLFSYELFGSNMYLDSKEVNNSYEYSPFFGHILKLSGFQYQYVTEIAIGDTDDLYTKHQFASYKRMYDYVPYPVKTTYYEGSITNDTKVRIDQKYYNQINTDTIDLYFTGSSYLFEGTITCDGENFNSSSLNPPLLMYYQPLLSYEEIYKRPELYKETTSHYHDGTLGLTETTEYTYNDYLLVESVTKSMSSPSGSDNETIETFVYPVDITEDGTLTTSNHSDEIIGISTMVSKNMINYPIESYSTFNDEVTHSILNVYHKETDVLNLKESYVLETTQPIAISTADDNAKFTPSYLEMDGNDAQLTYDNHYDSNNATILCYGDNNQIIDINKGADFHTAYEWGYKDSRPIAKIVNAASDEVFHTSFEDDDGIVSTSARTGEKIKSLSAAYLISKSLDPGNYLLTYFWRTSSASSWALQSESITHSSGSISTNKTSGEIDELRLIPINAQITTYTYKPSIGISTKTDHNFLTTYYEYDGFGRLKLIRDNDNNILQEYEYNYAQ